MLLAVHMEPMHATSRLHCAAPWDPHAYSQCTADPLHVSVLPLPSCTYNILYCSPPTPPLPFLSHPLALPQARYRKYKKPCVIAHEEMLLKVAQLDASPLASYWVQRELRRVVEEEAVMRAKLWAQGE